MGTSDMGTSDMGTSDMGTREAPALPSKHARAVGTRLPVFKDDPSSQFYQDDFGHENAPVLFSFAARE
jgi:hypothetical protein